MNIQTKQPTLSGRLLDLRGQGDQLRLWIVDADGRRDVVVEGIGNAEAAAVQWGLGRTAAPLLERWTAFATGGVDDAALLDLLEDTAEALSGLQPRGASAFAFGVHALSSRSPRDSARLRATPKPRERNCGS